MPVALDAVPETLLWNLYHRAAEARRPDTVLPDPRAVELVDTIDFPFEARFGSAAPALAQWQALRAACFDREVRRFLRRHPDGTVVALGEGSRRSSGASTRAGRGGSASTCRRPSRFAASCSPAIRACA